MKKFLLIITFLHSTLAMQAQYITNNTYINNVPSNSVVREMEPHEYDATIDADYQAQIKVAKKKACVYTGLTAASFAATMGGLGMMLADKNDRSFNIGTVTAVSGICLTTVFGCIALIQAIDVSDIKVARDIYFNGGSVTYNF